MTAAAEALAAWWGFEVGIEAAPRGGRLGVEEWRMTEALELLPRQVEKAHSPAVDALRRPGTETRPLRTMTRGPAQALSQARASGGQVR